MDLKKLRDNLLRNKKFYISILIDFSFLVILFLFLSLIIKKIQGYALRLQEFGFNLKQFESVVQKNVSLLDYNLLLSNVELMNQVIQKISVLLFFLLVGSFILYCLFQGIQWGFVTSNLKNFKKYFWKFSLVSLFNFSLSLLFLYYILFNIRDIFVNYLTAVSIFSPVIKIILLFILLLIVWYYSGVCYVLLAKYDLIKTLKKTFLFKNLKSVVIYLVCFVLVLLILFLFPVLGLIGLFLLVIELILILLIVNYCRYSLVEILKKY